MPTKLYRALLLAAAVTVPLVSLWAAQPTPTVPPFKCSIDTRRTPSCDTLVDGGWINSYTIGPGQTVSAVTPVSDSLVPAVYFISPPSPTTGLYLVRNMGELPIANLTSNSLTDGSGWEPYRASGVLAAAANSSTVRWAAIYNATDDSLTVTVSWGSMPYQ
jgi:hypothetical protein